MAPLGEEDRNLDPRNRLAQVHGQEVRIEEIERAFARSIESELLGPRVLNGCEHPTDRVELLRAVPQRAELAQPACASSPFSDALGAGVGRAAEGAELSQCLGVPAPP